MKKILSFLFLFALSYAGYGQIANDSVAIVKVLEKESLTWRAGDKAGHADCWEIKPYSRILVSLSDGKVYDIPPQFMLDPPANMIGGGGSSSNSNYKISIHGTNAWVSFDELSLSKDGKKTYSYEMKILEKMNGQWKIVGQSIHIYKPEKAD